MRPRTGQGSGDTAADGKNGTGKNGTFCRGGKNGTSKNGTLTCHIKMPHSNNITFFVLLFCIHFYMVVHKYYDPTVLKEFPA